MPRRIRRISRLLVANRGEIAIRVFRAATELGLRTVAIFAEEDRFSLHRYKADEAYQIGKGLGPLRAYLAIEEIVALAKKKGVDAIHPGYGFLAENARFAEACEEAGIIFVGPPSRQIAQMGDKVAARAAAEKAGLPVVPGTAGPVDVEAAARFARKAGFPLILKSAFGGGGRGMRAVRNMHELRLSFAEAERESMSAFGRSEIFVERLVRRPKHIEVQILGDHHGNIVHCFERDCSIQRRHQKVIELAPAPSLMETDRGRAVRTAICEAAVAVSREIGYRNAGTVEFLYEPEDSRFYFIEMNTRIQVEHTVTEATTGIDLVKSQIRIAEGYALDDAEIGIGGQREIRPRGMAIQCRITTEDPTNNFVPDYGRLTVYRSSAGHGVRLDAGSAHAGAVIPPYYDSLLVKLTATGRDLDEASRRMDRALAEFRVRGVKTNISFLREVMKEKEFLSGDCRTDYLERHPELLVAEPSQDRATRLLQFIGHVTVNGNEIVKGAPPPASFPSPEPPPADLEATPESGSRQILERKGADGLIDWIRGQKRVLITDTTFRDAHQSVLATRMRGYDIGRVAAGIVRREPGIFSHEMWGGATFDTALRFLKEDPWDRLRSLRAAMPNTLLQMLLRGANAVGYTNYPANVIRAFVRSSAEAGIDIFRIFDSLNWIDGMRVAIDAVRETGRIAEAAVCYTGNIEDASRPKYGLKYYVRMARDLEKAGAQILAIKDMAGLLRPHSAKILVRALKDETDLPIHLHTHDTSGIQGATLLYAIDAGVDIVDAAISSMSGLTSQVNLNALVAALEFHPRSTGLDFRVLNEYAAYWEDVRKLYAPFESDMKSGTATVYEHEMPGGQYTNLRAQAVGLGLGARWPQVVQAYRDANLLFGDIVKVTPSSKVVGDMALFMVANDITLENFEKKAELLSFPESVVGMMRGDLGWPPGGFPKKVRKVVLKSRSSSRGRPSARLKPVDLEKTELELRKKSGVPAAAVSETDVLSYIMYPQVTVDFLKHRESYGDTAVLPTPNFLYGLRTGEEISVDIEAGKTLYIKLIAISEPDSGGERTLFFELNGHPRDVRVPDLSRVSDKPRRAKADPDNLHHLGSPIPGRVVQVHVEPGEAVAKGDPLFVLEAMKMETSVVAPRDGVVADLLVKPAENVEVADLLMVYQ